MRSTSEICGETLELRVELRSHLAMSSRLHPNPVKGLRLHLTVFCTAHHVIASEGRPGPLNDMTQKEMGMMIGCLRVLQARM